MPGGRGTAVVVWTAGVLAAVLIGVSSAAVSPVARLGTPRSHRSSRPEATGYDIAPGPWRVATIDRLVLKDQHRNKTVEATVRYPLVPAKQRGSWPLVFFSHGLDGSHAAFADLTSHWASHGYVVVLPSHAGVAAGRRRHQRQQSVRPAFDVEQLDRLADVVFILDSLDQVEKHMDGFHGRRASRIDRDRIAIAGHSAGALTAQMAVGVKVRLSRGSGEPEMKNVGDSRFKAAIIISGQGTINRMLTLDSWTDLFRPLLVITGSRDVLPVSRETPESRQEPFVLARPGQKFLVFIEGATHASYAGRATTPASDGQEVSEADQRMITGVTWSATLAFLDGYVQDNEHAREYLASDDLVRFSGGKALLKRK